MAFGDQTIPVRGGATVATSDTIDLPRGARALYIGTGGDVKVITIDGNTLTFVGVASGSILPVSCSRVFATGTAASNIVALY